MQFIGYFSGIGKPDFRMVQKPKWSSEGSVQTRTHKNSIDLVSGPNPQENWEFEPVLLRIHNLRVRAYFLKNLKGSTRTQTIEELVKLMSNLKNALNYSCHIHKSDGHQIRQQKKERRKRDMTKFSIQKGYICQSLE